MSDEWDGLLLDGEEILWQGKPEGGFTFSAGSLIQIPFFVFFTGFSVFWMLGASLAGGFFWMFGLIFFFVGIGGLTNAIIGDTQRRRRSFYTLTNRRAFIAQNPRFQKKSLQSFIVGSDMNIEFVDGSPPSIFFATNEGGAKNNPSMKKIGFERISDAKNVMRLMGQIQQGKIE